METFYTTIDVAATKKQYGQAFIDLKKIIELYDPMELMPYEIEDEYDPETASILIQLKKELTVEQVHELVYNDFKYWFAPIAVKKEQYKDFSEAIYKWKNEVGL